MPKDTPQAVKDALSLSIRKASGAGLLFALNELKKNLSGRVLSPKTGRLLKDVPANSRTTDRGFYLATSVLHGIAWELGFRRPAYTVRPVRRKVLRFVSRQGEVVFSAFSKIPAQSFPARPFMDPAVRASIPIFKSKLGQELPIRLEKSFPNQKIKVSVRVV